MLFTRGALVKIDNWTFGPPLTGFPRFTSGQGGAGRNKLVLFRCHSKISSFQVDPAAFFNLQPGCFMNSRLGVTATEDMAVLLSELQALPSGFLLVEHTARRGRSPPRDGVEPEAGRPRVSHPATYRSGTPRVQSRGTAGRLPGCTPIFTIWRQQFIKHPG